MNHYSGPERRKEPPVSPVSIEAVRNGAQKDVEELLTLLRNLVRWSKRVGWVVGIGVASFIFWAGAWYFKVDDHIRSDELIDEAQDGLIRANTSNQARSLGIIEGMDRRLTVLENRQSQ